jgi:hypothetical protein
MTRYLIGSTRQFWTLAVKPFVALRNELAAPSTGTPNPRHLIIRAGAVSLNHQGEVFKQLFGSFKRGQSPGPQ